MFDTFVSAVELAVEPVYMLVDPHKRLCWLYLLSGGVIACTVWYHRGADVGMAIRRGLSPSLWLSRSSRVDMQWIVLNHILHVVLVVPVIGGQTALAMWLNRTLYTHVGEGNFIQPGAQVTMLCFTLAIFLAEDFSRFLCHYLYHKLPWLWRFHAIHHSADRLTPLTLYRIHSLEMALNSCRSVLVIGGLSGIFMYCVDGHIGIYQIMGASLFTVLFNLAGANLRHSAVWLRFGRWERYFISPAQHQIHHSAAIGHIDLNFGATLAIWDRWFGSWRSSRDERVETFGIAGRQVEQRLSAQWRGID